MVITLEVKINIKFNNDEIVEATSYQNIFEIVSKKLNLK